MSRGEGRKYGKGRILALLLLEEKEAFAACAANASFLTLHSSFADMIMLRQLVPVQQGLFQRAPAEHRAFDARGHMGDITESRGLFQTVDLVL